MTSHSDANRDFAVRIVQRLREAGFAAFWAGGCVRDQLLGRTPKDYDVATDARPEQVRELFGRKKTLAIGQSFGVITVLDSRTVTPIEVATFREDVSYSDGRHPDAIRYSHAREDARRRDFTINGLFYDPLADEIVDFIEGQTDLAAKVIRAIGDPDQRINEDKLRMLRAIRFSAEFEFAIEPATFAALLRHADEISQVSGERVTAELTRMLVGPRAHLALKELYHSRLWQAIFGSETHWPETTWKKILTAFHGWTPRSISQSLGAILLLADQASAQSQITGLISPLKLSNDCQAQLRFYVKHYEALTQAATLPWSQLQPILVSPHAAEAVEVAEFVGGSEVQSAISRCRECLDWPESRLSPTPLLNGGDLKHLGMAPGPQFSHWLGEIRRRQLDGELTTRADALEWLAKARQARPDTEDLR